MTSLESHSQRIKPFGCSSTAQLSLARLLARWRTHVQSTYTVHMAPATAFYSSSVSSCTEVLLSVSFLVGRTHLSVLSRQSLCHFRYLKRLTCSSATLFLHSSVTPHTSQQPPSRHTSQHSFLSTQTNGSSAFAPFLKVYEFQSLYFPFISYYDHPPHPTPEHSLLPRPTRVPLHLHIFIDYLSFNPPR